MNLSNPTLGNTNDTLAHAADVVSRAVSESSGVVADAAEHVAGAALNAAVPFVGSIARYLWNRNRPVAALMGAMAAGYGAYRWWTAREESSSGASGAPVRGALVDGVPMTTSDNGAGELTAALV